MEFINPKISRVNIDIEDCSIWYYSKNPFIKWVFLQRLKQAAAFIPNNLGKNPKILDIGTGCGFMLPTLSKKGKVIALDHSDKYLKKAKLLSKENGLLISYVKGNVLHLPFSNNYFSLVNALSVLEHIKDEDKAIEEIRRIINDDGYLIAGIPIERFLVNSLFSLLSLKNDIIDRNFIKSKKFRKNRYQDVHYSDIREIENAISKKFIIKKTRKIFLNYIPDSLSLYKIYLCIPK